MVMQRNHVVTVPHALAGNDSASPDFLHSVCLFGVAKQHRVGKFGCALVCCCCTS